MAGLVFGGASIGLVGRYEARGRFSGGDGVLAGSSCLVGWKLFGAGEALLDRFVGSSGASEWYCFALG